MKKVLITGGAGFIGSNFVHYYLKKHPEDQVMVLDRLTYAGNLDNLKDLENNEKYWFLQGDIADVKLVNELFEIQGRIEQWRGKRVVAFAGIAHPQTFFDMLRQNGLEVVQTIAFADHYRFREDDLSELVHLCRKEKAEWLLCTEKDLVKIQPFLPILETEIKITDVCLGAVSLQVQLDDAKKFLDDLLKRLTIE